MNSIAKIDSYPPTAWTWDQPGEVAIGSEEHRTMFCRMLLDTYDPYKPAELDWPKLEGETLARVTALPFWQIAVDTEDRASVHVRDIGPLTSDPLVKEAIELMAFEEARHRRVLTGLVNSYGIPIVPQPPYVPPPNALRNFVSTGYGECLDSFFAFGLFELAKRSGFFPPELVETFEPVIQEEARHIVFFVNWAAYTQANMPLVTRPWFLFKRMHLLAMNGFARLGIVAKDEEDFMNQGKDAVGIDISLPKFIDLCLAENKWRMGALDPRLLRPTFIPTMVGIARKFMRG